MFSNNGTELPRRTWSLAARLTAWYTGFSMALLLVVTGLLYWRLAYNLEREDDHLLAERVEIVKSMVESGDTAQARQKLLEAFSGDSEIRLHVRLLDGSGHVLIETSGMADVLPKEVFSQTEGGGVNYQASGKSYRLLASRIELPSGTSTLQIAMDRSEEVEVLEDYQRNLWIALGVAFVTCLVVGHQIASRGTRPVRDMAEAMNHIHSANLGEQLDTSHMPAELQSLAKTFNLMLGRLRRSFDQLTQFSSNIAHELRTPLNNLRGEVEVTLAQKRTTEEYREALSSCLEECNRLAMLVDRMLFLARAENAKLPLERESLSLRNELKTVVDFYDASAAESAITLKLELQGDIPIQADRTLLQRAVGNLIANALAHTGGNGSVTVRGFSENGDVVVEVCDNGTGIAADALPHIFDRFYRADGARSSAQGRVGLGLAIVRSICELHGGKVTVQSQSGKGTCFRLCFPCSGVEASSPR